MENDARADAPLLLFLECRKRHFQELQKRRSDILPLYFYFPTEARCANFLPIQIFHTSQKAFAKNLPHRLLLHQKLLKLSHRFCRKNLPRRVFASAPDILLELSALFLYRSRNPPTPSLFRSPLFFLLFRFFAYSQYICLFSVWKYYCRAAQQGGRYDSNRSGCCRCAGDRGSVWCHDH